MVAIYLTGITIAMFNIAGIGFVIFMLLFNHQSTTQLKRANFKKSSIAIQSKTEKKVENSATNNGKTDNNEMGAAIATGAAFAATNTLNGNIKRSGDFDNIDDILDDLDLSDFDDLDLDDFN